MQYVQSEAGRCVARAGLRQESPTVAVASKPIGEVRKDFDVALHICDVNGGLDRSVRCAHRHTFGVSSDIIDFKILVHCEHVRIQLTANIFIVRTNLQARVYPFHQPGQSR